jgi:hypothetical protein
VLPSALGGLWRVGPSRNEVPPARIMAEKNSLGGREISQSSRGARNQGEAVPETDCLVEGCRIGGIAAQQVQHTAARSGVGEHPRDHRRHKATGARKVSNSTIAPATRRPPGRSRTVAPRSRTAKANDRTSISDS